LLHDQPGFGSDQIHLCCDGESRGEPMLGVLGLP